MSDSDLQFLFGFIIALLVTVTTLAFLSFPWSLLACAPFSIFLGFLIPEYVSYLRKVMKETD